MALRLSGHQRKQLAERIKADINAACVALYDEGVARSHLGASEIGETCNRRLVYSFRWMHREQFDGRMLRLFNRGHKEEDRFIEWLKAIAAKVWAETEDGKQYRIKSDGHFGGSLDGISVLPYAELQNLPFLTEFKTHNDKSFTKLVANGVTQSKPRHYAQMCVYGEDYGFDYAIYFAINKNDDDIYVEVVALDPAYGRRLRSKAEAVTAATHLPARIAATSAFSDCKFCPMSGICHNGEAVDVNCRSCQHSIAKTDGTWFCQQWNATIPKDAILAACQNWSAFV